MGKDFNNSKRESFGDRKSFGNRGGFQSRDSTPREMHKATCADCGEECEVPFKPKEDRPVYCRGCFAKHKPKRF